MSEVVICQAVLDQLRETVSPGRDARWIDAKPTAQPMTPLVSPVFIAVHSGGWSFGGQAATVNGQFGSSGGLDNGISEEYWVHVTVSVKMEANHKDFWGPLLIQDWEGSLSYALRSCINAVHLQPDILRFANAKLQTGISSPFVEMLRATGNVDEKEERGPEWWGTTTTAKSQRVSQIVGYSQTVKFFGAKRIQGIGSYT